MDGTDVRRSLTAVLRFTFILDTRLRLLVGCRVTLKTLERSGTERRELVGGINKLENYPMRSFICSPDIINDGHLFCLEVTRPLVRHLDTAVNCAIAPVLFQ